MKEILTDYYSAAQSALYEYLKKNIDSFNDKTLFKAIQINCINADDKNTPSDVYASQCETLIDKLRKSCERLSELGCLLVYLNNKDYEQIAYSMYDKIDYSTIDDQRLINKLEPVRWLIRLLYLHINDKPIPILENLMRVLPKDVDASKILWEHYNFWFDTDDRDYELLIEMSEVVMKYSPNLNTLYFQAHLYLEMESYQKAIDTYYACLNLCEKNPNLSENIAWLYFHLANCSFLQGKYQVALEFASTSLKKYAELNPDRRLDKAYYPLVLDCRAKSHIELNNFESARKDIISGLEHDPENQDLLILQEELENI